MMLDDDMATLFSNFEATLCGTCRLAELASLGVEKYCPELNFVGGTLNLVCRLSTSKLRFIAV
jgi:hypothetical protein